MRRHKTFRKNPKESSDLWHEKNSEASEGNPLANESFKISPVSLFSISAICRRRGDQAKTSALSRQYMLPRLSALCAENPFASVAVAWDKDGLWATISTTKPFERASYPDVRDGDSVELFIDTRDSKASGFSTRFCHHFFFLPQAVEGHVAGEITRFRTEDVHEWCDAKELRVSSSLGTEGYHLDLFIPAHCLHGYDPDQFDRLGFTYRINRPGDDPQHFAVCSKDFQVEQQPSLWASLRLSA